jgi:CheY-like chemotaxis protein
MINPKEKGVAENDIKGLRILIIEDESLVMMLIEDTLFDIGCAVAGTASRLDDAMKKVSSLAFDAAILDVNLNGSQSFSIAHKLRERGIPFVFATGYGEAGIPEDLRGLPILVKPFQQSELERALASAVASRK